ncbi:MAG: hypothetical protein ACYC61_11450 [Isosphaeraceae bacterium]
MPGFVDERERNGLRTALDALAESDATAILIAWQEDADPETVCETCQSVGLAPLVIQPGDLGWIRHREEPEAADRTSMVWVLPRCLSALAGEDRLAFNESREEILALGKKLIFVEPYGEESSLREDYPDIFAIARRSFHLERVGNDELFDNGGANGLESVRRSYPPSMTRGSIVFIHGKPSFKAPPRIPCPNGHGLLEPGPTSITFEFAPAKGRVQPVDGWVCRTCGEAYVPSETARAAYKRAFAQ